MFIVFIIFHDEIFCHFYNSKLICWAPTKCLKRFHFSGELIFFAEGKCPSPNITNGRAKITGRNQLGAVAKYSCSKGYSLEGVETRVSLAFHQARVPRMKKTWQEFDILQYRFWLKISTSQEFIKLIVFFSRRYVMVIDNGQVLHQDVCPKTSTL